jgi:D-glycero-D-manno-heptose 1,7-bisphosphate phosphatase
VVTRAVFLDRDGVISANVLRDGRPVAPTSMADFRILPGVEEATRRLKELGFVLIVVTNQPDISTGRNSMATLDRMHEEMRRRLPIDEIKVCVHVDADRCDCRKPKPGMLLDVLHRYGTSAAEVPVVGDTLRDLQAADAAGCEPHFVLSGRARGMAGDELQQLLAQVPRAQVHDSLAAFADFLLQRDHVADSASGGLS